MNLTQKALNQICLSQPFPSCFECFVFHSISSPTAWSPHHAMLVFSGREAWGERRHLNHELPAIPMPLSPNLPRPTEQPCSAAAVLLLLILMQREVWRTHIQGAEEPCWLGKGMVRTGRKAYRWLNPFHSTVAPIPSMQICSAAGYREA